MFETRFLRLVHLCEVFENCSIRLSNDWNNFDETNDHSQQLRVDKLSSFFKSEALTFSSASLIHSTLTRNVATHREVFAPFLFIAFDRQTIPFFGFLYSCVPIFHFFSSDSQLCVVGFLIKQLFYSGLLDMKWSQPTRRYAPRWLYVISYSARPRRIIVK